MLCGPKTGLIVSNILYSRRIIFCLIFDAFTSYQLEKNDVFIPDSDFAQQLVLTTEDLRFADFLISSVVEYQKESKTGAKPNHCSLTIKLSVSFSPYFS